MVATQLKQQNILHCPYAKTVWPNTPFDHYVTAEDESISPIRNWLKSNNSGAIKQSIFVTSWSTWRDRCFKIFQNKTVSRMNTANHALKPIADIDHCMPRSNAQPVRSPALIQTPDNCGLPDTCDILWCDTSYDTNTNEVGFGLVLLI